MQKFGQKIGYDTCKAAKEVSEIKKIFKRCMEERPQWLLGMAMLMVVFIALPYSVNAQEILSSEKEIVLVLDASGSMKANDPQRLAIDSIAQLVYTLPSDYRVGIVAYNTDVIVGREPVGNEQREELMEQAEAITYADYSNAGAGLSKAVTMLLADRAKEKTIVLVSDGEILMEDDEATQLAREAYQGAVRKAQQDDIAIHVVGLGSEMQDKGSFIFEAAEKTGGGIYYTPQTADIQSVIDSILKDQLDVKQMTAAMIDTDGHMETITLDMPFANASKVRILLTGNTMIQNLNSNFQAENAKQVNGKRYSLIEVYYPKGDKIDLSFSGEPGSRIHVSMIPEYRVIPKADIVYTDVVPAEETAPFYEREASIKYSFHDLGNHNIQLWTEEFFNHSKLFVQAQDILDEAALEHGLVLVKEKVTESESKEILFDYSLLPANVSGVEKLILDIEAPPALPIMENQEAHDLFPGLSIAAVCLVGVSIAIIAVTAASLLRRSKPEASISEERPEPGKYSYVGKLNIYITRAPSGYDMPPLSYDLFRLPSGKVISLGEVLESCDVKEHFAGAGHIYFKADAGRSIILTNNSDCTILRHREILMKKKSYQISGGTKIDVTFEDEISELTIQYKDLKLSEMW